MTKLLLAGLAYLIVALGLEYGVFPHLGNTFGVLPWNEARLVALGVILAGSLRGEFRALPFALVAAVLAGSMPGGAPQLGCTIFSFTLVVYAAGFISRQVFLGRFPTRFIVIFALIVGESAVHSFAQKLFWPDVIVEIQWGMHFAVALLGALLYEPVAPWLERQLPSDEPIGRREAPSR